MPASWTIYAPHSLAVTYSEVRTLDAAILTEAPKLTTMVRQNRKGAVTLLKMNLAALDKSLKNKDGLTPEEIDLIADEVLTKWGKLISFADVWVVFRNARIGKYGELYQQLTAAKVIKWFDDYCEKRMQRCYEMNREADRIAYEVTTSDNASNLAALGYDVNDEGRIRIRHVKRKATDEEGKEVLVDAYRYGLNHERIAHNEQRRAELAAEAEAERQRKVDQDNAYVAWRRRYEETGEL